MLRVSTCLLKKLDDDDDDDDEFMCPTGFLCGTSVGLELIARVPERPGRWQRRFQETVEDVSVCNVLWDSHRAEVKAEFRGLAPLYSTIA